MIATAQLVFVFGTLKKGFPLHRRGLSHATCLGLYRTATNYPMLVAGPWFAPMMFYEPGSGLHVSGELYQVDPATLERLDRMESIGEPGNFRRSIRVVPLRPGRSCEAPISRQGSWPFPSTPDICDLTRTGASSRPGTACNIDG
ncbi:gamma-glutamylcyclotransferase family protein [Sinorhizobium glycinis]|uniref:gamma-glutamylcyclotransferase family protein n=1 Tax=Sinorhizobium glycinis TaxID=1472378 RepID=UPI000A5349E7|nr:gamma-glutamylcyclotransferase family protein [Sinorhizobium glycinis]